MHAVVIALGRLVAIERDPQMHRISEFGNSVGSFSPRAWAAAISARHSPSRRYPSKAPSGIFGNSFRQASSKAARANSNVSANRRGADLDGARDRSRRTNPIDRCRPGRRRACRSCPRARQHNRRAKFRGADRRSGGGSGQACPMIARANIMRKSSIPWAREIAGLLSEARAAAKEPMSTLPVARCMALWSCSNVPRFADSVH